MNSLSGTEAGVWLSLSRIPLPVARAPLKEGQNIHRNKVPTMANVSLVLELLLWRWSRYGFCTYARWNRCRIMQKKLGKMGNYNRTRQLTTYPVTGFVPESK